MQLKRKNMSHSAACSPIECTCATSSVLSCILLSCFVLFLPARSLRNFNLKSNCKDCQPYLILNPIAQDPKFPLKKFYSMCKITTRFLKNCFCPLCILKSSSIQNDTQQHAFSPSAFNATSAHFSEENKCLTPLFLLALEN